MASLRKMKTPPSIFWTPNPTPMNVQSLSNAHSPNLAVKSMCAKLSNYPDHLNRILYECPALALSESLIAQQTINNECNFNGFANKNHKDSEEKPETNAKPDISLSLDLPSNPDSFDIQQSFDEIASEFESQTSSEPIYERVKPDWNTVNTRAIYNVHISKPMTAALRPFIQESFATDTNLYYYLDYKFAMQYTNGGMAYFEFYENASENVLIIDTELHNKKGQTLYAICVPNDRTGKKQKWKIWDDHNGDISNAFMTKNEIRNTMLISEMDIPVASMDMSEDISVNENLLASFHGWNDVTVIEPRSRRNSDECMDGSGHVELSCCEFQKCVIESFQNGHDMLIPTVSFNQKKKHKSEYHMEQLLLVKISEKQMVAVTFKFNENNKRTEVSSISLDLLDCKNKSALADPRNGIVFDHYMKCNTVKRLDVYPVVHNCPAWMSPNVQ